MIQNAKRILIETETHEVFVVRINNRSGLRGFCSACACEQELLTLDESVSFSKTGALALVDVIRREAIHFLEASGGHILVCKSSLENWIASRPTVSMADTEDDRHQVGDVDADLGLIRAIQ